MAATAEIRFSADVRNAQKNIRALNSEVEKLSTRLESTQSVSRQTNTGVTALGTGTRQVSTQVRVASTALDSLEQSMNEARRSALGLRDRIINLNAELAENRKRLLSADGAQKQVIETRNRAIRVNQSFISVEKQRNSQALAQFTQQRRELGGLSGGYREAARGAGFLSRAGSELAGTLGAIGITELGFAAVRFGSETVNAAVKVEGFQNSLTALYGDAQVAERVLNDLRDAAQLPGITFQGAVRGAVRLKTVGVEGERSLAVIREWGNAAALGGSSADDMGRSLVGLTQILSRGKVSQEELNQILEAVPLIGNSIREAFGSIDAETIRDTLDAAGQDVNDFVDILVNQLSMGARASADSTANAFSNLGNATFELQAAIGAGLTPVAADFARGLTGVISRITDFIDNTDSAKDAQIAFREALENSDTVLEQRGAVDARISYLENYKQALFDTANELDKFDRRRQEIQSQVDDANEQLETLKLIREGAISAAQLRQELGGLVDEYSELFAEEQKREEQAQLTHLAVSNVAIARLKGILEEKAELESEIDVYRNYIDIAEAAQKGTLAALEADETAKNRNIAVTAMLTTTTREAVNQQKELADTIISNEQAFAILTPTVEQLALAYQAAQTVADLLDNSMTDLEDTLLTGADPLKEYVAGLTLTSESADAALGSVNEVGEAANNADFSRASEGLYDFQDAVENTRRSHIDFRDVVDRETTPAVEDLTTALDASAQTSEQTQRAFDALDTVMDETGDTAGDTEVKIGELGETSDETARSTRRLEQEIFNVNKALAEGKISAEDAEEQIGLLRDAFNTFGHDGTLGVNQIIGAFDTLADSLADAEGSIGDVGVGLQGLADLFSNPLDFAANTLGAVFVGLANANTFGGPLGLPEGFFDDPVPRGQRKSTRGIYRQQQTKRRYRHTPPVLHGIWKPPAALILSDRTNLNCFTALAPARLLSKTILNLLIRYIREGRDSTKQAH